MFKNIKLQLKFDFFKKRKKFKKIRKNLNFRILLKCKISKIIFNLIYIN